MKKRIAVSLVLFAAVLALGTASHARSNMLSDVNAVCGTSYGCGLCHIDPKGGGPLTSGGDGYAASGNNACYFCQNASSCNGGCVDADGDGYFAQSGCGTGVDCNDGNPAINPGAVEACSDGTDNDCDGKTDCADASCATTPACASTPEICTDRLDNDGDRKVDCADRDCVKDPACAAAATEGGGKTCSDGKDNDGDGLVDCADPGCAANRVCK